MYAPRPTASFARTALPLLMSSALGLSGIAAHAAAPTPVSHSIPGLSQPARIIIDHWGIAHLYAASPRDAFFLQGYNAARDRLWQIDLWRKRGLGLLAKSFGPAYVDQDRAARLFLYRGDMNKEWAGYAPGARDTAEAFVAGINAYVAQVRSGAQPLPREFTLTHSMPDTWTAEDVVRIRSHGLVANVASEVKRAQVACKAGLAADRLRAKLEPPHDTTIPPGLDPCSIPADVLKDYDLATASVSFAPERLRTAANLTEDAVEEGSNNWAIAPSHTRSGRPILANDPHRRLSVPSLRYIVHLDAPGMSLIGAGEPALPGVSLGHNEHAAFGLTIFEVDQEDLYVYSLKADDPDHYRYGKGWEAMRVELETIEVKGEKPRQVELRFTRHGPVLAVDPKAGLAFAVRSVWHEAGTTPYFGSTWFNGLKTWKQFLAARDRWGVPPLNLVYADVKGNIGWAPGARIPVRRNWDGLLPVPGDGRYEWKGFLRGNQLPSMYNPQRGWVATANEMNLPKGYPAEQRRISFEWANRSRIDRIEAVLGGGSQHSIANSMALQTDAHNVMSRRLIGVLASVDSPDPQVSKSLALLRAWNGEETIDSVAAAIYQVWTKRFLSPMTVARATPDSVHQLIGNGDLEAVIDLMAHPDSRLGADPEAGRRDLLLTSLADTVGYLTKTLGPDMDTWRWGRLHQMKFVPAIATLADVDLRARLSLPAVELPGSSDTPRAASFGDKDFAVTSGASVRLVMDVGEWDRSMAINSPGQSGDAGNPHYRDLLPLWAAGQYVPLLYSKAAVERAAETVIELTPAAAD